MPTSHESPTSLPKSGPRRPQSFRPFYMRLADRSSHPGVVLFLMAFVLGAGFLGIHFAFTWSWVEISEDLSWLLAAMILVVFLLLSYATVTLRDIFPEMEKRIYPRQPEVFLRPLNRWLSDRNFILAGVGFGLLNDWMGYQFGICPEWSRLTILVGFFIVGFISGMAAYSIVGVSVSLSRFITEGKPALDYRSPDRSGGLSFLGTALMKFGIVTFIMGVLISLYIVFVDWENKDEVFVKVLMWFWIAFPYAMSSIAFLVPAISAHKALQAYKDAREEEMRKEINAFESRLEKQSKPAPKELQEEYEYAIKLRAELYAMRTWPYDIFSIRMYVTTAFSGIPQVVTEAQKLLHR